ncbi:hypothetical protein [Mycolicibacterium frederiksbergense]|uniref:hypothetical protein n=1 Tax=Mycolicibacterium frederiksbergense TaxID=117567 RepID=UPI00399BCBA3
MKTVLGLSVTAAGVGWVLVEGTAPVDDDKFAVRGLEDLVPRCLAAVRGAQSIAASSGRRIDSIGVCWSPDVEQQVITLLAELRTAGWPDVRSVRQVTPGNGDVPPAQRAERTDLCGLLAGMLADDPETDVDDETAFVDHDMICGPDAGRTPAYDAARAVVTGAAPAEPVPAARSPRNWVPEWTPAISGARLVSAAAVTAVVALFAVGSQFVGTAKQQPAEAALAGSSTAPTAQTTQVVPQQPPAVQPMAAAPEPTPALAEVSEPPVQLALPQAQPVAEAMPEPAAPVEPRASAEPLAAPQLPAPEAAPAPAAEPVVPEPAVPLAAPVPAPEVLPPAPVVPPPPFWMLPPFVPAPPPPPPPVLPPAPEALAAPVEHLPPPAPAAPVDPVLGALP